MTVYDKLAAKKAGPQVDSRTRTSQKTKNTTCSTLLQNLILGLNNDEGDNSTSVS